MDIRQEASRCTECGVCLDVCPTYKATGDLLFSPLYRLKTAVQLLSDRPPEPHLIESIYNCPKCLQCEMVCPESIKITDVVHFAREYLVRKGYGPLPRHDEIINGILTSGNSVNGDPSKRLDWLPEQFPYVESDTLLYLGCLPSYLVKDAAASTYLVLKKLGISFMILEEEGCCGTYIYETGKTDIAGEFFRKNVEKFDALGIKEIIVPCNGCMKCFKYFYPRLLGDMKFRVRHVMEVICDKIEQNHMRLRTSIGKVTYQDSCRLSRGEKYTKKPRDLLEWCGTTIAEPEQTGENMPCCGAGSGIRSVYRDLSLKIASDLLIKMPADTIVSACPFCVFNLNYTAQKKRINKQTIYFTNLLLNALS